MVFLWAVCRKDTNEFIRGWPQNQIKKPHHIGCSRLESPLYVKKLGSGMRRNINTSIERGVGAELRQIFAFCEGDEA